MAREQKHEHQHPQTTRTARVWWAMAGGLLVLLLVAIFMVQNSKQVPVHFLWMKGTVALGLALLLATVMGALVVVLLGSARIIQMRVQARRAHQARAESESG